MSKIITITSFLGTHENSFTHPELHCPDYVWREDDMVLVWYDIAHDIDSGISYSVICIQEKSAKGIVQNKYINNYEGRYCLPTSEKSYKALLKKAANNGDLHEF